MVSLQKFRFLLKNGDLKESDLKKIRNEFYLLARIFVADNVNSDNKLKNIKSKIEN